MSDDAPTAFVTVSWRRHMRRDDGSLDRRAYELCALGELNDRLRAGDVWVEDSRGYRAIDGPLIPLLLSPTSTPRARPRWRCRSRRTHGSRLAGTCSIASCA